ncbi:hypothetical protein CPC08DRAFT_804555 [Agrocybe pediades]|nr:hypothetical protein CPC08DRAFT_804555 [Agrocybe pediades]
MCECVAGEKAKGQGLYGQRQGAALQVFFYKLCNFRRAAPTLIFVLDGDERPEFKRGTRVVHEDMWWTGQAIELLQYFGYYFHRAPGEAEAELAEMNRRGIIDGASTVLRSVPSTEHKTYKDGMILYTADRIRDALSLSFGGLVLYCVLSGGDYNQSGVKGVGPTIAAGLGRSDIGDTLLAAIERGEDLDIAWLQNSIRQELKTNSQKKLTTSHPRLANELPENFVDIEILNLYLHPITSWSSKLADSAFVKPSRATWHCVSPSIHRITQFCQTYFGWQTQDVLKKKFHNNLWQGVFAQMLYSPLLFYDPITKDLKTPNARVKVLSVTAKNRRGQFEQLGRQFRLQIAVNNFVDLMGCGCSTAGLPSLEVWACPEFLPSQVLDSMPSTTKKSQKRARKGNIAHTVARNDQQHNNTAPPRADTYNSQPEAGSSNAGARYLTPYVVDINRISDEGGFGGYNTIAGGNDNLYGDETISRMSNVEVRQMVESFKITGHGSVIGPSNDSVSVDGNEVVDLTRDSPTQVHANHDFDMLNNTILPKSGGEDSTGESSAAADNNGTLHSPPDLNPHEPFHPIIDLTVNSPHAPPRIIDFIDLTVTEAPRTTAQPTLGPSHGIEIIDLTGDE